MKRASFLFVLLLTIVFLLPVQAESWRDYFRDGVHYYNIGAYEKANDALQLALELNPPGPDLRAARDAVGPNFWSKLLSNPKTRPMGYRLLKRVYDFEQKERRDTKYVKALVEQLVASETNFQLRWETVHKLVAVGQFACPELIHYLGVARNEDARKAVRMALEELSYRAVLPLIEALSTKKEMTRQNAITVLGVIGDPRAAAALRAIFENETGDFKKRAEIALNKIKTKCMKCNVSGDYVDPDRDKSGYLQFHNKYWKGLFDDKTGDFKAARVLYLYKALRYLRETEYVADEAARDEGVIWIWNSKDEKLEYRQVPLYAYNEMMAEEAGFDCLNQYPDDETVIPVLISAIAAQIVEAENLLRVADDRAGATNLLSGEKREDIEVRLELLKEAFVLVNLTGPKHLYKALEINEQRIAVIMDPSRKTDRMVKDYDEYGHDAETFMYLCRQLENPEIGQWNAYLPLASDTKGKDAVSKPGESLTQALRVDDKKIRYAAAIALANMNPAKNFQNAEDVIPILTKAVGESKEQVILLVSKSMNDLNRMSSLVGSLAYVPQLANSGAEGLKKARQFPVEDVIVVDARDESLLPKNDAFGNEIVAEYHGQNVRSFMRNLKKDLYTKNAPVVFVVADEEQEAYYSNDKELKDWVSGYVIWGVNEPVNENYFADIIKNVIAKAPLKEQNKIEAFNLAAAAAESLAKIDRVNGALGSYISKDLIDTLIEVIESREDPIRVPSIEALGLYKEVSAIQAIVRVLNHPRSSKASRLACIRALGRIDPVDTASYTALKTVLQDSDFDIRKEAGVALGHVSLDSKRLLELLEQQRIEKELKER